jgi:predicted transcriptional regulator of viral defense system
VPLGITNPKKYNKSPLIMANKIFVPCYISGFTSANYWNFTEQIFKDVVVITSKMFRNKNIELNGTTFILKHEKNLDKKNIINIWEDNTKIAMASPAQTIVDILDTPALGGGIRHISKIIEEYFESKNFDETKLLECLKLADNKTIYKRLGYIMHIFNIKNDNIINFCLKNISSGYSFLDPDIKSKGKILRNWNLRINAEL